MKTHTLSALPRLPLTFAIAALSGFAHAQEPEAPAPAEPNASPEAPAAVSAKPVAAAPEPAPPASANAAQKTTTKAPDAASALALDVTPAERVRSWFYRDPISLSLGKRATIRWYVLRSATLRKPQRS